MLKKCTSKSRGEGEAEENGERGEEGLERNEKEVNKKLNTSIEMVNQVDGTEAEVDPRLGDFKDQFMLPVGSVIPKYFP